MSETTSKELQGLRNFAEQFERDHAHDMERRRLESRRVPYQLVWGNTTFNGLSRRNLARNIFICGFYYRLRYPSAFRNA